MSRPSHWSVRSVAYASANMGSQAALTLCALFVPVLLSTELGATPLQIGLVCSIVPIVGALLQPFFSNISDHTPTPLGRRFPYLLVGLPLATAGLLAAGRSHSIPAMCLSLAVLFAGYGAYVGPYRASLPEETPREHRLFATGLQTFFKGLGTMITLLGGGWAMMRDPAGPYILVAVLWVVGGTASMSAMRIHHEGFVPPQRETLRSSLRIPGGLGWFFAANGCWWFALHAMFGYAFLFVVHDLCGATDLSSPEGIRATKTAMSLLGVFTTTSIVAALPMSRVGRALGHARTLVLGLACLAAGLFLMLFSRSPTQACAYAVVGGIGFAVVQLVPVAWLFELRKGREGALAGLLSLSTDIPQILALSLVGALIQATGTYRAAFAVGAASTIAAILLVVLRPGATMSESVTESPLPILPETTE